MNYWRWNTSGRGGLVCEDEVLITSQKGIALYDGKEKTEWVDGKALLTTHHIIYECPGGKVNKGSDHGAAASDRGTSLVLPLETVWKSGEQPSCTTGLAFRSDKIVLPLPAGKYCRMSFREGGMRSFFEKLLQTLERKAWVVVVVAAKAPAVRSSPAPHASQQQQHQSSSVSSSHRAAAERYVASPIRAEDGDGAEDEDEHTSAPVSPARDSGALGIAGIMRASAQSVQVKNTLADIDDVMGKASALVESIRLLRQKANASPGVATAADTTAMESIEATLGLGTLVTRPDLGPFPGLHRKFHEELAGELHGWMTHPRNARIFGEMPIVPLVELFSLYNRARSGDLVSPEDVLAACKILHRRPDAQYTLETLASGRKALVHKDRSLVLSKLVTVLGPQLVPLTSSDPKDTTSEARKEREAGLKPVPQSHTLPTTLRSVHEGQVATLLRVTVPVAQDVLRDLEQRCYLCSSDVGFGCSVYHWNIFLF